MIFNTVALISALAASVSALYLSSSESLTHNGGVAFCASNGNTRLIDVTFENKNQVMSEFPNKYIWIGSWNYDYGYWRRDEHGIPIKSCLYFYNGHVGEMDCADSLIAVCNNPVVYKSTAEVPADQQQTIEEQFSQVNITQEELEQLDQLSQAGTGNQEKEGNEQFQYLFLN